MINQKWVTDISEFKYGVGEDDKKGKLYLSVILDLCDRRPVAFVYSTRNDTDALAYIILGHEEKNTMTFLSD